MDETKKGYIEIHQDKSKSYEYFSSSIMSYFCIPETQIEQLYLLMQIKGKTTMFSNRTEKDLQAISKILTKCNIKHNVLIYDTKNWT